NDVVRLVHLDSRVRVDEVRELALAAALLHLRAVAAAAGTRVDLRVEVERGERLPHLAAVRAGLELVELEELLGTLSARARHHAGPEAGGAGEPRGRDVEGAVHASTYVTRTPWRSNLVPPADQGAWDVDVRRHPTSWALGVTSLPPRVA